MPQAAPLNLSPANGAIGVVLTPTLVASATANTVATVFVAQYEQKDGLPVVLGWSDDPRRR